MTDQHTPGPWRADEWHEQEKCWTIQSPHSPVDTVGNAWQRADANLIAAAPDLLAELETCRRLLAGGVILEHVAAAAAAKADAAIAKARGEA